MTRTVEEVEADFAATQAAWQDAVREAHRLALQGAGDLRRRAIADDGTVSAAELAAAEHEAEFAALRFEARQRATESLEAELRSAKAEQFADEFGAAIEPLRQDFEESMAALEVALGRVVESALAGTLASLIAPTKRPQGWPAMRPPCGVSPSTSTPASTGPSSAAKVFGPVNMLVQKTLGSLQRPLR